jgi:hypothetical protein
MLNRSDERFTSSKVERQQPLANLLSWLLGINTVSSYIQRSRSRRPLEPSFHSEVNLLKMCENSLQSFLP